MKLLNMCMYEAGEGVVSMWCTCMYIYLFDSCRSFEGLALTQIKVETVPLRAFWELERERGMMME